MIDLTVNRPDQYIFYKFFEEPSFYERLKSDEQLEKEIVVKAVELLRLCGIDNSTQIRKYYNTVNSKDIINKSANTYTVNHKNIIWSERYIEKYNNITDTYRKVFIRYPTKIDYAKVKNLILNHLFPERKKVYDSNFTCAIKGTNLITGEYDQEEVAFGLKRFNRTLAFPIHKFSNIFVIDIDNHNYSKAELNRIESFRNDVVEFFGLENIFLLEESYSKGYHVYIKLSDYVDEKTRKIIKKQFEEKYGYELELPSAIRMFGSLNYRIMRDFNSYYENIPSAISGCIEKYHKSSGFNILNFKKEEKKPIGDSIEPFDKIIKQINAPVINAYYKKRKSLSDLINPEDFIITPGTRYKTTFNLCSRVYFFHGTVDMVKQILTTNGSNSKDIHNWQGTDKFEKSIEEAWKYISTHSKYTQSERINIQEMSATCRPEQFISNEQYIPEELYKKINNKYFLSTICKNSGYKVKPANLEKVKDMLLVLFGKALFLANNPKELNEGVDDSFKTGFQISKFEFDLLRKERSNIYRKSDTYLLGRNILNKSGLFKNIKHHLFFYLQRQFNKTIQWSFIEDTNNSYFDNNEKVLNLIYKSINKILNSFKFKNNRNNEYIKNSFIINSIINIFITKENSKGTNFQFFYIEDS